MKYSRTLIGLALVTAGVSASAQSITTLFAENNQGNLNASVYFDIVAGSLDIEVSGWDWNIVQAAGVSFGISVWTRPGGAFGFEESNAGWVFETGGSGVSAGPDMPSVITQDNDFLFPRNTTTGVMLVTGLTASHHYTTGTPNVSGAYGTATNATYSNADMTILLGGSTNSPWNNANNGYFNPRIANFTMYYTAIPEPGSMIALGIGVAALLARRRRKIA